MSKSNKEAAKKAIVVKPYQFPNSRKLWHDKETATPLLGCDSCQFRERCGGLQIAAQVFDCLTFCTCTDPSKCDNVCPKNPGHLVARLHEVGGLSLDGVPRAQGLPSLVLPSMLPMIYHSSARTRTPTASAVVLSLYALLDKQTGELSVRTKEALCARFKIHPDAMIVLSGTDEDPPLERWWKVSDRTARAQELAALGVKLITAPNFSLFDDVPRHDNLYNIKRIAIAAAEIQSAGVHCAIHLNARTDADWDGWISYLLSRPEYEFVAFEFGTGAGSKTRFPWYVEQLSRLAKEVERPLNLLVRGGMLGLAELSKQFATVTLIDTAAFVRAQKRRRGVLSETSLAWEQALTAKGQPIDDLLDENVKAMDSRIKVLLGLKHRPLVHLSRSSDAANDAGEKPLQVGSLA